MPGISHICVFHGRVNDVIASRTEHLLVIMMLLTLAFGNTDSSFSLLRWKTIDTKVTAAGV